MDPVSLALHARFEKENFLSSTHAMCNYAPLRTFPKTLAQWLLESYWIGTGFCCVQVSQHWILFKNDFLVTYKTQKDLENIISGSKEILKELIRLF